MVKERLKDVVLALLAVTLDVTVISVATRCELHALRARRELAKSLIGLVTCR